MQAPSGKGVGEMYSITMGQFLIAPSELTFPRFFAYKGG
jgi:hypothetical protein